jgi:hypothetical protein
MKLYYKDQDILKIIPEWNIQALRENGCRVNRQHR